MGCGGSTQKGNIVEEMTFHEEVVPSVRSTKRMFKVVCIGCSGVGKTALMHYWVKRRPATNEYKTTIGADFMAKTVTLPDNSEALLQVWDTAGQEKFASLGRAFFRGSDLCVLVCAVDDPASLESLVVWRKEFLELCEPADPLSFPFIVLANKCDLQARLTKEQIEQWARVNQCLAVFQTSALTGTAVDDAFMYAAKMCAKRQDEGVV